MQLQPLLLLMLSMMMMKMAETANSALTTSSAMPRRVGAWKILSSKPRIALLLLHLAACLPSQPGTCYWRDARPRPSGADGADDVPGRPGITGELQEETSWN